MRKTVVITIDLQDNDTEDYNWLVDDIALENVIRDRLEEGAIVHSISVEISDK